MKDDEIRQSMASIENRVRHVYNQGFEAGRKAERKTDTCENAGEDYAEVDQFVCSKCGIELQDWHSVERCDDGEIIYHDYTFRFCPNCGRRIDYEEGADE